MNNEFLVKLNSNDQFSQLKWVYKLEENMSHFKGQNSLIL